MVEIGKEVRHSLKIVPAQVRLQGDWPTPVYDALHQELVKGDVLHADETTLQVLHEPGKKAQALHRRG